MSQLVVGLSLLQLDAALACTVAGSFTDAKLRKDLVQRYQAFASFETYISCRNVLIVSS